jgi:hypothetical protein
MPNFNPFSSDAEDTSFETGTPVTQAAKTITNAASKQADEAYKKANEDIVSLMYGPSTPQEPGTDEANTQHTDASNAATRAAATHAGVSNTAKVNPNQTPEEQAEMEKIRQELFGNYSMKYKSAVNGAQNLNTNLEIDMDKARREREQMEMERKKQEEEEEQQKKEAKEQEEDEGSVTPAGKKTGFQFGKKQQEPIALRLAKTKTEGNRGTSG